MKSMDTHSGKKIKSFILVGLLIGIVYFPAIFNQFVNWDDDVHLTGNYFIQTPDEQYIQRIFLTTVNGIYIPLTTLSFAIEHFFFGNTPWIYHLNNVLLHLAVTLLIIPLACRLGLTFNQGILAAVLFGLHPMHVESVAWVTERKDVLYAMFYLLGLLVYMRYLDLAQENGQGNKLQSTYYMKKWGLLGGSFMCGVLSALSKPMAMSFPLVLLLLDVYFQRKLKPFVLLEKFWIGMVLFMIGMITFQSYAHQTNMALIDSVLIWVWSLLFYIYKFFAIDYFVIIYKFPQPITLTNPVYLWSCVGFLAMIIAGIKFRRQRLFIFALLFYVSSIFLVLRWDVEKDINMVADRYMYLPSLGFCLWLGAIGGKLLDQSERTRWRKKLVLAGMVLLMSFLGYKTHQQVLVWKNSVNLWEHQLRYQPQAATALAYNKLASAYADEMDLYGKLRRSGFQGLTVHDQKLFQKILDIYQASLSIKPDYADSLYRLARIYQAKGELSISEDYLIKTIRADPDHFEAFLDLGEIYLKKGNKGLAYVQFQKAISINPTNRNVIQRIHQMIGK